MGRHHAPLELGKDSLLRLSAPLTVIAASERIEELRAAKTASWIDDFELIPLELSEAIQPHHLAGAGIVVLHLDPNVPSSMDRIARVRSLRPELPQIVALDSADLRLVRTLVREGVA